LIEPLEARTVLSTFVLSQTLPLVPAGGSGHQPQAVAVGSYLSGGASRAFVAASYEHDDQGNGGGVSVFLGSANGQFNSPIDIALPSDLDPKPEPEGIVVGRFTDSKFDDIAVADNHDRVFIIRNNGDGSFGNPFALQGVPEGAFPTYPATAMIHDSSYLFVSGFSNNQIMIFKLDSAGNLERQKPLSGVSGPNQILVTVLNQDGKLDLAVANKKADFVTIYRGKGDGTFQLSAKVVLHNPLVSKLQSVGLTVGDFNGDKSPDVAVADYGPYQRAFGIINILKNTSTHRRISFKNVRNIQFPGEALVNVVSFDLGDSQPGLAVTSPYTGQVDILHRRGPFRFVKAAPVILGNDTAPADPGAMIAADLPGPNGSTSLALIVANSQAQTLSILRPS
jgi:hypothetical protein